MTDSDVLAGRLAAMQPDELADLLRLRPEVLRGVPPVDLNDLAMRLWHQFSLGEALRGATAAHLQVLEAAASLGDGCRLHAVVDLLADSGPDHRTHVDAVLAALLERAVVVATGADDPRLALPDALGQLMPNPLRLGRPLAALLADMSVDAMRRIQTALRLPKEKNRAATVASLVEHFADPDRVLALLASAPPGVMSYIGELIGPALDEADDREGPDDDDLDDLDDLNDDDDVDGIDDVDVLAGIRQLRLAAYDPARYRQEIAARDWAQQHGLLIPGNVYSGYSYGYGGQVPAEVARALRGRAYRAPFTPVQPRVVTTAIDPDRVAQAAAAAAGTAAGITLTVLDHVARAPLAAMKTGGVGVRELAKLAKNCSTDEATIRLTLECANALRLLDHAGGQVKISERFTAWRDAEPAHQFAQLLQAWREFGANPTEHRDDDGKPRRALATSADCAGCRDARTGLLSTLAELPADVAAARRDVVPRVLWRRPFAHVLDCEDEPLGRPWREAELLGVLAIDALSPLGRALLAAGEDTTGGSTHDDLLAACRAVLPNAAERATFGSDLTAYAVGAPSARVSAVLDSTADRESSGGAVTWRFSPASVRRALDDGATADALLVDLDAIAAGELPQPLRYLVHDVARRHGNLRLSATVSVVRSDETALLAEVAADRKLAKLRLRLLAPTVLAADVPVETLLAALRSGGYFPMLEQVAAPGPSTSAAPESAGRRRGRSTEQSPAQSPAQEFQLRQLLRLARGGRDGADGADAADGADGADGAAPRAQLRAVPRRAEADPVAIADALLRADRSADVRTSARATPTERILTGLRTALSPAEIRQLAAAIDARGRVQIEYLSQSSGRTRRVISGPELSGGTLFAWCELRQDERYFTVSRILSVAAV